MDNPNTSSSEMFSRGRVSMGVVEVEKRRFMRDNGPIDVSFEGVFFVSLRFGGRWSVEVRRTL
jgi:hypothetical protein